jgi:RNA polymerase sigma-70 factor (ECF subfamily)
MTRKLKSDDSTLPTRRSLLKRLRDVDDDASWRDFFQTYWKLIYAFAVRCGCSDAEAEEVVQETVITIARKMPDYHYDPVVCSFKGWLMHVTNWRVIDQIRKRRTGKSVPVAPDTGLAADADAELARSTSPELESLWDEEWEKNLIDAAMERIKGRINAEHYQIFHLLLVKKLPPGKVAAMLKISTARVYLVKHRVSTLVQKEIKALTRKLL